MAKHIHIKIDVSDEALVGSYGWEEYDAAASKDALIELIIERVSQHWPSYDITVERGAYSDDVYIYDERREGENNTGYRELEDEQAEIREIMSEAYQSQLWLR